MDKKKLEKLTEKICVKTSATKTGFRLHVAQGPNTKSLAIAEKKGKLFITSTTDPSFMIPTTCDEIAALAANVSAGNFAILDKK